MEWPLELTSSPLSDSREEWHLSWLPAQSNQYGYKILNASLLHLAGDTDDAIDELEEIMEDTADETQGKGWRSAYILLGNASPSANTFNKKSTIRAKGGRRSIVHRSRKRLAQTGIPWPRYSTVGGILCCKITIRL